MEDVPMLKLIVGVKGSGKTKTLIELANDAVRKSGSDVICIERIKLIHDRYRQGSSATEFNISSADELWTYRRRRLNRDVTDIFVTRPLRFVTAHDVFEAFIDRVAPAEKHGINFVITSSSPATSLPRTCKVRLTKIR